MGAGGGGGGGNIGGVSQPTYMPGGGPMVTPPNPMNIPMSAIQPQAGITPPQAPSGPGAFRTALRKAGQVIDAWNQQGQTQRGQQTSGPQYPVNFNMPSQPYIPPPQAGNPNFLGNAFYGG